MPAYSAKWAASGAPAESLAVGDAASQVHRAEMASLGLLIRWQIGGEPSVEHEFAKTHQRQAVIFESRPGSLPGLLNAKRSIRLRNPAGDFVHYDQ